jgi:Family of unknown function (DUF6353)
MLTTLVKQTQFAKFAKFLIQENSTTVLTGVGVVGVVATAVLTGRSSFKAATIIRETEELRNAHDEIEPLNGVDVVRLVWKVYIPPVLVGAGTIASVIAANRLASRKIAALVVASGISERALKEYKERVVEKFGEGEDRKIHEEIAQNRIDHDVINKEVIIVGGEVLCYDMLTGRYFQSSHEAIMRAENLINRELVNFCAASMSEFFDELGVPATTFTDTHGWDVNNHVEVQITATKTPDNRPCLAIDFHPAPVYDYNRHRYD